MKNEELKDESLGIEPGYLSQLFHDAHEECKCDSIDDPPCWSCEAGVILSEMNVKV